MINVTKEQLNIIKNILKEHVPGCEVRAFGSRVKGSNKEFSDLDLAIVGKEKLGFAKIGKLIEDFQESTLPFRVDVLDWLCISDEFKKIIEEKFEVLEY